MDNVKHKPTGGDKKIFDDKDYLKHQKSGKSSMDQSLSGSQVSFFRIVLIRFYIIMLFF